MKKYQLLERAMKDYPAGTIARFKDAPNTDHVSTGVFQILDINSSGNTDVFSVGGTLDCFYISHDPEGNFIGEWATPTTKSGLLDGKVAIQVNNKSEFKLLMKHFHEKKWITDKELGYLELHSTPEYWTYRENPYRPFKKLLEETGFSFIPFSDFAAEVGIKDRAFVLKSVDGVDLYEGDEYIPVYLHGNKWAFENSNLKPISKCHTASLSPNNCKAFASFEAAEKWIEEQNKPKDIQMKSILGYVSAKSRNYINQYGRVYTPKQIEEIYLAQKSL